MIDEGTTLEEEFKQRAKEIAEQFIRDQEALDDEEESDQGPTSH